MDVSTKDTNPKDTLARGKKVPLSVVPATMNYLAAIQMHNGAGKYGAHNYRAAGARLSVYYDAARRHLDDWFNGNELDEDGIPNLAGLAANVAIICDAATHGYAVDDRPPAVDLRATITTAESFIERNNARNQDKRPRHYTIADPLFNPKGE